MLCRPLQEASFKTHKASKVLILGNLKMLLSTGTSRWNDRQIALWDQVRATAEQLTARADLCHPNSKVHLLAFSVLSSTLMVNEWSCIRCQYVEVLSCDDTYNHLLSGDWSVTLLGHMMIPEPAPFIDEDHKITLKKLDSGPLSFEHFYHVLFPWERHILLWLPNVSLFLYLWFSFLFFLVL